MIWVVVSSVGAGILGSMGLGGGSLLLLYLTLVKNMNQLTSQGINLIFFIPCASLALYMHSKNKLVEWKLALKLALWGIVGVLAGWWLAGILETSLMTKILGAVLLVMGIKDLFTNGKD